MRLLKTGFAALFIISLAASCSTYKSCPAYSQENNIHQEQTVQVQLTTEGSTDAKLL
ncbi:hypothetical protein PZB74_02890 [Porifericola rhodea]|uniref:hypothetical protein n=1 Tax=Porifericola rhodea TaxID=930972 RepID=UPI0026664459|nr:hypothetical protein [Porifericola rhodea]WKN32298.1 hypothetical protein PZB74_02890 [Porifericola rhodea]